MCLCRTSQPRDSNVVLVEGGRQRRVRSIAQARAGLDYHHGRGDERDLLAGAALFREYLAERDHQLLAVADDPADGANALAFGRCQQVRWSAPPRRAA